MLSVECGVQSLKCRVQSVNFRVKCSVFRLLPKIQLFFWKRRKSIAPVTQNEFRQFFRHENVRKCHPCHAKRHDNLTCVHAFKKRGFAASPIDTARPQENQRLETRHVGASKRPFRARLPPIFTLRSFKIDVFLPVFSWTSKFATSKSMFRAKLPSIFSTSQ